MRRNRVLILFAVVFAMSTAVIWLGNVLANVVIDTNNELKVNVGESRVIDNGLLQSSDSATSGGITYTLITTPTNGDLVISNTGGITTLLPISQFLQTDIDGNFLVYNHASPGAEIADTFDFTVTSSIDEITDTFSIVINQPPTINNDLLTISENVSIGTFVGTVITADANAPNDSFTYTISTSEPSTAFAINSGNGDITTTSLLDFEALGATPHFTLAVQIEDSGLLTDTAVININVIDINEPPVLDDFTIPDPLPENSGSGDNVGTVPTPTDPDAGETFTYSITGGNNNPDPTFDINNNGLITVASTANLDYETTQTYDLTVQVEDSGGITDTATITINMGDVNEAPTVDPNTFTVAENSPNGTTEVGTVTASDPENDALTFSITAGDTDNVFDIDPDTGVITVAENSFLDFEALGSTMPQFSITVQIVENATTDAFTDTATIEISVTDVNEDPTVNDNSFSINENSSNTTVVGIVTASDPDADDIGLLTFGILSGNTGGAFTISNNGSNNGQITVADSNQLDYETTQSFMLGIIVTDTGGLNNTANVTVNINNLFDEAPTVNNATFTVAEGSNNGVVVGTVSATDPEFASGDELTFAITGGNTGTVFAINSSTGQITVPDTSKLDADTIPTFNLTVRATDKGGQIDTGIITINVTPLPTYYVYMPILMNNYPPIEPNNNCSQSYGIGSGTDYVFTADDTEDWYAITLTSSKNLTVILSSFEPAQGQLIVYSGSCSGLTLLGSNGNPNTTDKTLNLGVRPAGTYYIRVYSSPVTNTTYTLRVNAN